MFFDAAATISIKVPRRSLTASVRVSDNETIESSKSPIQSVSLDTVIGSIPTVTSVSQRSGEHLPRETPVPWITS